MFIQYSTTLFWTFGFFVFKFPTSPHLFVGYQKFQNFVLSPRFVATPRDENKKGDFLAFRHCNGDFVFQYVYQYIYMGVSKNRGNPKSTILIGFSIINHPFWGTPNFWKHPYITTTIDWFTTYNFLRVTPLESNFILRVKLPSPEGTLISSSLQRIQSHEWHIRAVLVQDRGWCGWH